MRGNNLRKKNAYAVCVCFCNSVMSFSYLALNFNKKKNNWISNKWAILSLLSSKSQADHYNEMQISHDRFKIKISFICH